jgi:hypothetical protein
MLCLKPILGLLAGEIQLTTNDAMGLVFAG